MNRFKTFAASLLLISSLWPTVSVAQQAVQNFPPNTVLGRLAIGTGPGQAIPFATLAAQLFGGYPPALAAASAPVGGMTLLASPSGSGNCITSACKLPTACSLVRQISTFIGSPNIQLADGTYTTADASGNQCHITGNAGGSSNLLTSIVGNSITPTNVVIAIQSGQNGFGIEDGGEAGINNLEITNVNGGGVGIVGRQNAVVDYRGIFWGAWGNSGSHVAAFGNAVVVNPSNETLLASTSFLIHWNVTQGAYVLPGGTTTIQSSVSWSGAFANVNNANMDTTGWTLSGTGTGSQFTGTGPGYLNANAACASVFPGTGGCTITKGFQTSNGDNPTSPVPAGGVSCPSGITAGTVTVVNGVVTHC